MKHLIEIEEVNSVESGDDKARSLVVDFATHQVGQQLGILVVNMAERFVEQQVIERLAKSPHRRHTLALS